MSWLLTKLRGVYRVMANGAALPDVPAINFSVSPLLAVGAVYDSVKNRINVTLPFGAVTPDLDTFVIRGGDGEVTAHGLVSTGDAEVDGALLVLGTASVGGGVGQFGSPAPALKPDITGSRSGATVAVIAQILTVLAANGTLKNSTTS